jgi:CHAP domain
MSKIVEVAQKEIGVSESPKNSNKTKYGEWFSLNGVPWCAIFVSWVYFYANKKLPNIGFKLGFAGCQTGFIYFKKNGWITKDPVPGDIVLFDWNMDGRHDHVGIFIRWVDNQNFETIEGNTSLKNQSNGGNVMSRKRNVKNAIFVHPIL